MSLRSTARLAAITVALAGTSVAVVVRGGGRDAWSAPSASAKTVSRGQPASASASGGGGRLPHAVVPEGRPPAILPLAEVRPGMVGEALTVFQGTKPEPFKLRVISILRNFVPKQDVILVRAEDPRVEHSGIVAGMSGSPFYIDGKLVGAVAYTWSFAKDPLGGVTPIEAMLAERARPQRLRGREDLEPVADAAGEPWPWRLAAGAPAPAAASTPHLERAAVPLSLAGFSVRSVAGWDEALRPLGLVPLQAGGGRRAGDGGPPLPGRVEPGSAVAVELVRGDMSAAATGTVTYVDGDTVLAFGHPMFGFGELYLPLADAEIHSFMSSVAQSFKLSSPLHEIGTLVQDRSSGIVGDLSARSPMIPVDVNVTGPGGTQHRFHAEIARNRRLTPMLAGMVVSNALGEAEPDLTDAVITVEARLLVRGAPALTLRDELFSPEGLSGRVMAMTRGARALGDVLGNPFRPATVDGIAFDARVEFKRDVADIVALALPGDRVRPGATLPLRVTLRPYAGPEYVETVAVTVPRPLAGQSVKLEVATGAVVKPELAPPDDFAGLLDNLRRFYTANQLVVTWQTADDGVALRGRLLPGLPAAAADTLRPAGSTRRGEGYRVAARTVVASARLVSGKQELQVLVEDDPLGARR